MAVYQDIDISAYSELPEVFLSIMGIPDGADVASLAVGVIYGFYGALTLAGLAVSMGSASIAGEERDGTIGLLLGNPKSRTNVLVSKAASMLLLVGLGAFALWACRSAGGRNPGCPHGRHADRCLCPSPVRQCHLLRVPGHGDRRLDRKDSGLASGVSAGIMALGFVAVGIFPIIEGWENVAKVFPWHYFDNGQPVINGIQWGHLAVLIGAIVVLAAIALVGVNRRDLRSHNLGSLCWTVCGAIPLRRRSSTGWPVPPGFPGSGSRPPPSIRGCSLSPPTSCSFSWGCSWVRSTD